MDNCGEGKVVTDLGFNGIVKRSDGSGGDRGQMEANRLGGVRYCRLIINLLSLKENFPNRGNDAIIFSAY